MSIRPDYALGGTPPQVPPAVSGPSPRDLVEIGDVFGFAPETLVQRAARFRKGQGLFAGGFVEEPTVVQMGARLCREGGGDVPVPLG
ncbi:hypothetical protein [Ruania alba]|uniref:hypothetical protein n=1 Tax=Ruania alba TaxID=648782 RepID=UPI001113A932|nr:hypothetical protein [Ruania alba]